MVTQCRLKCQTLFAYHHPTFKTDLQIIFGMLQYKEDKNALRRYISDNENYNMCKAIDDMM